MKHNSNIVKSFTFNPAAVSKGATSVVQLSHIGGAATVTAIARAKGLPPADRVVLALGAWAIGSALAHELGGKKAAKEFTVGMLAGAVQLAA